MLTTTLPRRPTSWRARRTRLRWPACRQPIVGTNPTRTPSRCQRRARRCMAPTDLTIRMSETVRQPFRTINPIVAGVPLASLRLQPALEYPPRRSRPLVRARLVNGSVCRAVRRLNQAIGDEVGFQLRAAHVRQHLAVDLDARTERLAALLDHFLPLPRVVDDVAVFNGKSYLRRTARTPWLQPQVGFK